MRTVLACAAAQKEQSAQARARATNCKQAKHREASRSQRSALLAAIPPRPGWRIEFGCSAHCSATQTQTQTCGKHADGGILRGAERKKERPRCPEREREREKKKKKERRTRPENGEIKNLKQLVTWLEPRVGAGQQQLQSASLGAPDVWFRAFVRAGFLQAARAHECGVRNTKGEKQSSRGDKAEKSPARRTACSFISSATHPYVQSVGLSFDRSRCIPRTPSPEFSQRSGVERSVGREHFRDRAHLEREGKSGDVNREPKQTSKRIPARREQAVLIGSPREAKRPDAPTQPPTPQPRAKLASTGKQGEVCSIDHATQTVNEQESEQVKRSISSIHSSIHRPVDRAIDRFIHRAREIERKASAEERTKPHRARAEPSAAKARAGNDAERDAMMVMVVPERCATCEQDALAQSATRAVLVSAGERRGPMLRRRTPGGEGVGVGVPRCALMRPAEAAAERPRKAQLRVRKTRQRAKASLSLPYVHKVGDKVTVYPSLDCYRNEQRGEQQENEDLDQNKDPKRGDMEVSSTEGEPEVDGRESGWCALLGQEEYTSSPPLEADDSDALASARTARL